MSQEPLLERPLHDQASLSMARSSLRRSGQGSAFSCVAVVKGDSEKTLQRGLLVLLDVEDQDEFGHGEQLVQPRAQSCQHDLASLLGDADVGLEKLCYSLTVHLLDALDIQQDFLLSSRQQLGNQ